MNRGFRPATSLASRCTKNASSSITLLGEEPLFQRFFGQDVQIITHFLSPDTNPNDAAPNPLPFGSATWQSSFDSSKVWAQVPLSNSTPPASPASIPAGSDPSCPNTGSIACLLLQSIGSQQGPTGGRVMTKIRFLSQKCD